MGQVVTYNGLQIDLATVSYSGTSLYDSADRILQSTKMVFKINGIITSLSGGFSENLDNLHSVLSTPGREFLWQTNGTTMWCIAGYTTSAGVSTSNAPSVSTNGYADRRWGPKPRNVSLTKIHGGRAANVSLEIEVVIAVCVTPSDVEEFNWAFSYAIDRNFSCSRTCVGTIVVKSTVSAADGPFNNNAYFPVLPKGFYRDSQSYTLSPDGRVFTFTITDKQVWRTLPAPMTDGQITMLIDQQGATIVKTMTGSLTAPFDKNKQIMAQFIVDMIQARFPGIFPNISGLPNEFITHFSITNHEFENKLDFSISTKLAASTLTPSGGTTGNSIMSAFNAWFGDVALVPVTAGSSYTASDGVALNDGIGGTAKLQPVASGAFAVCDVTFVPANSQTKDNPNNSQVSADQRTNTPTPGAGLPTDDPPYDTGDAHKQYPYTTWVDSYQFILDYNNKILQTATADVSFSDDPNFVPTIPDTVQQVARPKMTVVQTGMARRLGIMPEIPAFFTPYPGKIVMMEQNICPESPRLLADGESLEFTTKWQRRIYLPGAFMYKSVTDPSNSGVSGGEFGLLLDRPLSAQIDETFDANKALAARYAAIDGNPSDTTDSDPEVADTPNTTGLITPSYDTGSPPSNNTQPFYPTPT